MSTNTKSIDFEADSNQFLSISDDNQTGINITGDISFECWIKMETNGVNAGIFGRYDSGSNERAYRCFKNTSNQIEFWYSADGLATNQTKIKSTLTIADNNWHYLAVVCDVSAKSADFYVDGSSETVSSYSGSDISIYDATSSFYIGLSQGGGNDYIDAAVDEVIVWNDLRTSGEIAASYNSGSGKIYVGNEAGMVAYWRFEDDILDLTSNNNDLTNNNSATFSTDVPFSGSPASTFIPKIIMS